MVVLATDPSMQKLLFLSTIAVDTKTNPGSILLEVESNIIRKENVATLVVWNLENTLSNTTQESRLQVVAISIISTVVSPPSAWVHLAN